MRLLLAFCLMLLAAPGAHAFTPESGWWWNPSEPGRGYAIEVQDDVVFLAVYAYDADGQSIWFTAAGQMTGNTQFSASLDYFEAPPLGGNCLACPWSGEPENFNGAGGPIDIVFKDRTTADLVWDGGNMEIERFNFALGDPLQRLRGEWQMVLDFSSEPDVLPYGGEILVMDQILVDNAGRYVSGCRPANSQVAQCSNNPTRPAAGELDGELHVIAVDDSRDTFAIYYLDLGFEEVDGLVEIYNKQTEAGRGTFYPVRGHRTASRAFVNTGIGPNQEGPMLASDNDRPGLGDLLAARGINKLASPAELDEKWQSALPQLRASADRLIERLQNRR